METDVPVALSSFVSTEKSGTAETWTKYFSAPEEELQVRSGLIETFEAVSIGDVNEGASGIDASVVNEYAVEYALVPPAFVALTRQ